MDFVIIYERKIRELENAIMLKLELERRGYQCSVFQYLEGSRYNIFNINPPKIILVPHMYDDRNIYRTFFRFGHARYLVNLQYEQVLSDKWEKVGHHNPKGEAQKAIHICWGIKTYDRLKDAGVSENNLKLLGALQLDLLREEYRQSTYYTRKFLSEEFGLETAKRWTLFISSFAFADILEDRLKMNEDVASISLKNHVELHTQSRDRILDWLTNLLEKDKENLIIYRPHPEELSINKVIELEKKYSNFRIISNYSVKVWIENCDNMYSWYSTAVVESHFLNKPYSIIRPIELPDDFDNVVLKRAKFITDYKEFELDYFKDDNLRELPIDDAYIREYYQVDKNYPSYIKYCDMLEELYNNIDTEQPYKVAFKEKIGALVKALVIMLVNTLYKRFNIDLNQYRRRNKNRFLMNWFIEMDNQIATESEKKDIEDKLRQTLFNKGFIDLKEDDYGKHINNRS